VTTPEARSQIKLRRFSPATRHHRGETNALIRQVRENAAAPNKFNCGCEKSPNVSINKTTKGNVIALPISVIKLPNHKILKFFCHAFCILTPTMLSLKHKLLMFNYCKVYVNYCGDKKRALKKLTHVS